MKLKFWEKQTKKVGAPVVSGVRCPQCGSTERRVKGVIDGLKERGLLPKEAFPEGAMIQIPLLDTSKPPALLSSMGTIKAPVVTLSFDACVKCGTLFCTNFVVSDQDMMVQMQQVKRQGTPPPRR